MENEKQRLASIFSSLAELTDPELARALRACLHQRHAGFPVQSPHADNKPEDVLWRILRAEDAAPRLKDAVHSLLVCEFVRILSTLRREEKCLEELEHLRAALVVIQKAHDGNLKLLLFEAASAVLEPENTVQHDVAYDILGALQACGVDRRDREFWLRVVQHESFAALAFHSFIEMDAVDCFDILWRMHENFDVDSSYVDFRFLGKCLLRKQGVPRLKRRHELLLDSERYRAGMAEFLEEVLPDLAGKVLGARDYFSLPKLHSQTPEYLPFPFPGQAKQTSKVRTEIAVQGYRGRDTLEKANLSGSGSGQPDDYSLPAYPVRDCRELVNA